ncbi:MAG: deoxyribonuclease V [Calditrichota bacterium]|jgi:deoxyribonuclease V
MSWKWRLTWSVDRDHECLGSLWWKHRLSKMKIKQLHSWRVSTSDASNLQQVLSKQLITDTPVSIQKIRTIAAADVSFNRFSNILYAAVVLFTFPDLELHSVYIEKYETNFPYIPGYLSFREAPPILKLFHKIKLIPDVLLCDGQGIAHPRRLGLASHLGLFLDLPSIGCAKSVLVGEYQEPTAGKGSYSYLYYQESIVGAALRTREKVKPVYVSPGHKIDLRSAIRIILKCSPKFRIPEPLRVAHQKVNEMRRSDGHKE